MQARLARQMTSRDPRQRPTCSQVLGQLLVEGLWTQSQPGEMATLVSAQHLQTMQLRSELQCKEHELAELRRLLSKERAR